MQAIEQEMEASNIASRIVMVHFFRSESVVGSQLALPKPDLLNDKNIQHHLEVATFFSSRQMEGLQIKNNVDKSYVVEGAAILTFSVAKYAKAFKAKYSIGDKKQEGLLLKSENQQVLMKVASGVDEVNTSSRLMVSSEDPFDAVERYIHWNKNDLSVIDHLVETSAGNKTVHLAVFNVKGLIGHSAKLTVDYKFRQAGLDPKNIVLKISSSSIEKASKNNSAAMIGWLAVVGVNAGSVVKNKDKLLKIIRAAGWEFLVLPIVHNQSDLDRYVSIAMDFDMNDEREKEQGDVVSNCRFLRMATQLTSKLEEMEDFIQTNRSSWRSIAVSGISLKGDIILKKRVKSFVDLVILPKLVMNVDYRHVFGQVAKKLETDGGPNSVAVDTPEMFPFVIMLRAESSGTQDLIVQRLQKSKFDDIQLYAHPIPDDITGGAPASANKNHSLIQNYIPNDWTQPLNDKDIDIDSDLSLSNTDIPGIKELITKSRLGIEDPTRTVVAIVKGQQSCFQALRMVQEHLAVACNLAGPKIKIRVGCSTSDIHPIATWILVCQLESFLDAAKAISTPADKFHFQYVDDALIEESDNNLVKTLLKSQNPEYESTMNKCLDRKLRRIVRVFATRPNCSRKTVLLGDEEGEPGLMKAVVDKLKAHGDIDEDNIVIENRSRTDWILLVPFQNPEMARTAVDNLHGFVMLKDDDGQVVNCSLFMELYWHYIERSHLDAELCSQRYKETFLIAAEMERKSYVTVHGWYGRKCDTDLAKKTREQLMDEFPAWLRSTSQELVGTDSFEILNLAVEFYSNICRILCDLKFSDKSKAKLFVNQMNCYEKHSFCGETVFDKHLTYSSGYFNLDARYDRVDMYDVCHNFQPEPDIGNNYVKPIVAKETQTIREHHHSDSEVRQFRKLLAKAANKETSGRFDEAMKIYSKIRKDIGKPYNTSKFYAEATAGILGISVRQGEPKMSPLMQQCGRNVKNMPEKFIKRCADILVLVRQPIGAAYLIDEVARIDPSMSDFRDKMMSHIKRGYPKAYAKFQDIKPQLDASLESSLRSDPDAVSMSIMMHCVEGIVSLYSDIEEDDGRQLEEDREQCKAHGAILMEEIEEEQEVVTTSSLPAEDDINDLAEENADTGGNPELRSVLEEAVQAAQSHNYVQASKLFEKGTQISQDPLEKVNFKYMQAAILFQSRTLYNIKDAKIILTELRQSHGIEWLQQEFPAFFYGWKKLSILTKQGPGRDLFGIGESKKDWPVNNNGVLLDEVFPESIDLAKCMEELEDMWQGQSTPLATCRSLDCKSIHDKSDKADILNWKPSIHQQDIDFKG